METAFKMSFVQLDANNLATRQTNKKAKVEPKLFSLRSTEFFGFINVIQASPVLDKNILSLHTVDISPLTFLICLHTYPICSVQTRPVIQLKSFRIFVA